MEPVEALRRVVYRLEATGEANFKIRAFRNAASLVEQTGIETIKRLGAAGRLTSLPGIGDSIAAVIDEVLRTGASSYLEALEVRDTPEQSREIEELRAALRGDCHSHSDWSDGATSISEMALAAKGMGHEFLALTDHSPRLTVAHGLSPDRLIEQLDVVAQLNSELSPFRILTGIEVDILEDGTLDQDPALLARLDVVIASVHSKLRMEKSAMTRRMIAAIESPSTDILGHATGRILFGRGRPESQFDHQAVFAACARTGTVVEVNSRPERRDPRAELLEVALEAGCHFSIDTDAHAPGQLEWLGLGCEQAVEAGVTIDRVINAQHLGAMLEWVSSH